MDANPLHGSVYAHPVDWYGVASSVATVNLIPSVPPGNTGGGASGCFSSFDIVGGPYGYQVPTPSVYVTFSEGNQVLGRMKLNASSKGLTHFRPERLSIGHHTITISYEGDAWFLAQATQTVEFDIVPTQVAVVVKPASSPWYAGQPTSLSIEVSTLTPDRVAPTGRVDILCDGKLLATALLGSTTTVQNVNLSAGPHQFQAIYYGNADSVLAQSPVVWQNVNASPVVWHPVGPTPLPVVWHPGGPTLMPVFRPIMLPNETPVGQISLSKNGKLTGWVSDPDSPKAVLRYRVVVDGVSVGSFTAKQLHRQLPPGVLAPSGRGFTRQLSLSPGKHKVRVLAIDAQSGQSYQIGRAAVRIPRPASHRTPSASAG